MKENISRFDRWRGVAAGEIDSNAIVAAKAIGAHEMILRLPAGYDTVVGQGGIGLSGGQTQRIAIARALYGAPRVVIFDEPNAHLDADATASLFDTISRLKADGVTIVIAAHSADLLSTCSRLLVLAGGRLAERPVSAMQPMHAPIAKKA